MDEMLTLFQKRISELNNIKLEIPAQKQHHMITTSDINVILDFELFKINERETREIIINHNRTQEYLYDRVYELILRTQTETHNDLLDTFCIRLGIEYTEMQSDIHCPICKGAP